MTDNAWYGVSQELVAARIAQHVAAMTPESKSVLVDAFCGVGGNTIAFAMSRRWKRVYAIEKDPATLECARRNAEIYGVKDRITWFLGDCFELLGNGENAVGGLNELVAEYGIIFGSPPWGGKIFLGLTKGGDGPDADGLQDQATNLMRSSTSNPCNHTRSTISSRTSPASPRTSSSTYHERATSVRLQNVLKRERKGRLFTIVRKQAVGRCAHIWGTSRSCSQLHKRELG